MKKLVATLWCATCLVNATAHGQTLSVDLMSMKTEKHGTCSIYWAVQNKTGLNITYLSLESSFKEADGSIIVKQKLLTERIKNGESVDADNKIHDTPCSKIKTIKLGSISNLKVDGNIRNDLKDKVEDVMVPSSKVSGVSVVK